MSFHKLSFRLFGVLVLLSCSKDEPYLHTTNVSGYVLEEGSDEPLVNAIVWMEYEVTYSNGFYSNTIQKPVDSALTDENGHYALQGEAPRSKFVGVYASADGYRSSIFGHHPRDRAVVYAGEFTQKDIILTSYTYIKLVLDTVYYPITSQLYNIEGHRDGWEPVNELTYLSRTYGNRDVAVEVLRNKGSQSEWVETFNVATTAHDTAVLHIEF